MRGSLEISTLTKQERSAGAAAGIDRDSYRNLMRHQVGAVTIIAAGSGEERAGLTATAVASLSDTPPTVLVCVQRSTGAHDRITAQRFFSVNLLTRGQRELAERFAGRHGVSGADRFDRGAWTTLISGAPVLETALASLDCELIEQHGFTTHSIFIGRVLDGRFNETASPLLYFRNDFWDWGEA